MRLLLLLVLASVWSCGDPVVDELHADFLQITSVEPLVGPSSGGTSVTIGVRADCDAPSVTFRGSEAAAVSRPGPGTLTVRTPPLAIGDAVVEVTCDGQSVSYADPFRFKASVVELQTDILAPAVDKARVADFNGDGIDDLASIRIGAGKAGVYLGTGRNGFETEPDFSLDIEMAVDVFRGSLDVGDFTGDGRPDFAIAHPTLDGEAVRVAVRRSEDAYQIERTYDIPTYQALVTPLGVGDFDGDGDADVIAMIDMGNDFTVVRYVVDAAGRATEEILLTSFEARFGTIVWIDDFDQDGRQDVLIKSLAAGLLHVMGADAGNAVAEQTMMQGMPLYFDDDRWPDITSFARVDEGEAQVRRGTGPGTFGEPETFPLDCDNCGLYGPVSTGRHDLDRNGITDYIFGSNRTDLHFVELETGVMRPLHVNGLVIGAAQLVPGTRPTLLRHEDEVHAMHIVRTEQPFSPVEYRSSAPLLDTRWTCYGDFDGYRVAVGSQQDAPTKLTIRDALVGEPLGEPQRVDAPTGIGSVGPICRPARFGDDLAGFLLDRRVGQTDLLRVRSDRSLEVITIDGAARPLVLPSAVHARYVVTRVDTQVDLLEFRTDQFVHVASGTFTPSDGNVFNSAPMFLNDDDVVDIITVRQDGIGVHYGRLDGDRLQFERVDLDAQLAGTLAAAPHDLDGDGDWDLVVATQLSPEQVVLYENTGSTFARRSAVDRSLQMTTFSSCDLDKDGAPDLIFDVQNDLGIALAESQPIRFGPLSLKETGPGEYVAWTGAHSCSDVDADGLDDVVVRDLVAGTIHAFYNLSR